MGLLQFIDDAPYRKNLLRVLDDYRLMKRNISAVDAIIRNIIEKAEQFIFVTNNLKDFHDVCYKRTSEVIVLRKKGQ